MPANNIDIERYTISLFRVSVCFGSPQGTLSKRGNFGRLSARLKYSISYCCFVENSTRALTSS